MESFPFYKQTSKYNCGIFCLKIIAKYYGEIIDIEKYINVSNPKGMSIYDLCNIIEEYNFHSDSYRVDNNQIYKLNNLNEPLILHWNDNHFVVLYKIINKKYYISNPVSGLEVYNETDFKSNFINIKNEGYFIKITKKITNPKKNSASIINVTHFIWNHIKKYKITIYYILLIISVITLIYSILPFITRSVFDIGIGTKDYNFITILLVSNVFLIIFKSIGEWIKTSLVVNISSRMRISIVSDYLDKILKLPIHTINKLIDGDIIQRSKDQERIQQFISTSAINVLMSISILSVYSIILLFFNSSLFYIFISFTIIYIIWILLFFNIRKKIDIDYYKTLGKNESIWINILNSFEDIKLNNLSLKKRKEWEIVQVDTHNIGIKLMKVDRIQQLGSETINSLKDLSLTFFGAYLVIHGKISFGTLISIQFIISQVNNPVLEVVNFIRMFQSSIISYSRVNQINSLDNEQNENNDYLNVFGDGNIILNNVTYRYADKTKPVLTNINCLFKKNKINIIIGKSGSGKTTILKLISTTFLNYFGDIFIGNNNLKNINLFNWRNNIGVCFQDSRLYNDSILNNIILNNEYDESFFNKVIIQTNLYKEINSLENGILTVLSSNGTGLSDGQKQRLILARALYKKPKVLLLDEITSNLDKLNENFILNAISNLKTDMTIIMSSHSLSSLEIADNIIIVENGHVIEQGSLEQLKRRSNSKISHLFNINNLK